jgi:hypothetical protein
MGSRAFVIAGGHAALIANDVNDFRYHAAAHYVPVGVQCRCAPTTGRRRSSWSRTA